jgi:hypothetical protein
MRAILESTGCPNDRLNPKAQLAGLVRNASKVGQALFSGPAIGGIVFDKGHGKSIIDAAVGVPLTILAMTSVR